MSHHAEHAGLQSHSVGDHYPWSVVVIDNAAEQRGRCVAKNLVSVEILGVFPYNSDVPFSFEAAHRAAEACFGVPAPAPAPAPLVCCRVLVPVANNNGELFHESRFSRIENRLLDLAGGFTRSEVSGSWRCPAGDVVSEGLIAYDVAIESTATESLRRLASEIAVYFGQECVYLAVGHNAELIPPAPIDGRHNWFGTAE